MKTKSSVLLVDDDEAIHQTVSMVLQHYGWPMRQARTGKECLALLRDGFRGVLLMDVMMPEMDGWDTIRAMADEKLVEGNVICMLTAVTSPGSQADGLAELVLDYLPKPFTGSDLLAMIDNAVNFLPGE